MNLIKPQKPQDSNGWLARYSIDLMVRLTDDLDPCE